MKEVALRGQSSTFEIKCTNCAMVTKFDNCKKVANAKRSLELNRRLAYAGRSIGVGHSGLRKFCAVLDLPPPLVQSSYNDTMEVIHEAVKKEAELSMKQAIAEEVESTGSTDITVSGDGSWLTRGHSSKLGIVTLIGAKTGKPVDRRVLSTVCHVCNAYKGPKEGEEWGDWWEDHKPDCKKNHDGSAGMMEVNGTMDMFRKSIERGGVRYANFIGDGDTKTFKSVTDDKPYRTDLIPKKFECVAHVQKRMGAQLRNLKKQKKGADGKPLGGKGRLTDSRINRISQYYGKAIRENKDVDAMHRAIWTIYHHYRSTDQNPTHDSCPKGKDSWCAYNKAVALRKKKNTFKHTNSIPVPVMDAIRSVFENLTNKDLLLRCVGGYTQNLNEALNAMIWKIAPKTSFVGKSTVEIAADDAIFVFNDGQKSRVKVMEALGITPGKYLVRWVNQEDRRRMQQGQKVSLESTKEARSAKRRAQALLIEDSEQAYKAGAF